MDCTNDGHYKSRTLVSVEGLTKSDMVLNTERMTNITKVVHLCPSRG